MSAELYETPERCDNCPVLRELANGTEQQPLKITVSQDSALRSVIESCPGYKKGVLGLLRTLRIQFHESLAYGGLMLDLDSGTRVDRETFTQPQGCGTPLRHFTEIARPITNKVINSGR